MISGRSPPVATGGLDVSNSRSWASGQNGSAHDDSDERAILTGCGIYSRKKISLAAQVFETLEFMG